MLRQLIKSMRIPLPKYVALSLRMLTQSACLPACQPACVCVSVVFAVRVGP